MEEKTLQNGKRIFCGGAVGLANSLFGGGGGMLAVPLLQKKRVWGKASARYGNFGDFARIFIFLFAVFYPWFLRFFRIDSHVDRGERRRRFGCKIIGQIAYGNGKFTVCVFAGGGRAFSVF